MTVRVARSGRTYTQGSHKNLGPYPRVCHGCGGRVRITRDTCWQETTAAGVLRMWHFGCRPVGGESEGAG